MNIRTFVTFIMALLILSVLSLPAFAQDGASYRIVDSNQSVCYDNAAQIACPDANGAFYGQDAQYSGNAAQYQDNGDGTITDLVTGLMWQQDPGTKMTYDQAVAGAASFNLGGYTDWRLPTIKELYSLILFDGTDVSGCNGTCAVTPFIDTRYFHFSYGDTAAGERVIDSQFATSTKYVSTTMRSEATMFGVNFADGRIKGYGTGPMPGQSSSKTFYVLYVRGNTAYGQNSFVSSGNGTITDNATGLTWMQFDSGTGMNWEAALSYCEALDYGGASDWRLPNVKELQSLVDYSRSPDTSGSAAIDPLFQVTSITNEAGQSDYPFYWSSTTHAGSSGSGAFAAYVSFGRALGYMNDWMDVHGAGAQRSDPKTGSADQFPQGHGPQGDAVRVSNYVRCVRGGSAVLTPTGSTSAARPTMSIESTGLNMQQGGQGGQQPPGQNGQGGQGGQGGQNGQMPPQGQNGQTGQNGQGGQQQPPGQGGGQNGQGGRTPPQEAISACSGLTENTACQISLPNQTISGTCQTIQQQLACVPANRP